MAFVTYPLNNVEYRAEDAELYNSTRTSGVYSSDDFSCSATGANNIITIAPGIAWMKNARFSGKVFANTEEFLLQLDLPDASLPRFDVVAIRFDKSENTTSIVVKKGSASSSPVLPEISQTETVYELYLCSVFRQAGALVVTAADVFDLRLDETVCGVMRDGVTRIPTEQLQQQAAALINELREAAGEIVSGSATLVENNGNLSVNVAITDVGDGTKNINFEFQNLERTIRDISSGTERYSALTSPLIDGAEYRIGNVSRVAPTWPNGYFESWISFTAGSGISVVFPSTTKYIGELPEWTAGASYEISIKDGVVLAAEVSS